jgi:hypothetical protein
LSQELLCSICLINIENDNELIQLRCSHFFHCTCIDEWLQSKKFMSNQCPICRDYIVKRSQTNNPIIHTRNKPETF